MTAADDRILEFLLNDPNERIIATPSVVEMNVDYAIAHVRNRLGKLLDAGLVEYFDEDRAAYRITDRGEAYLKGELDAEDLENLVN